MNALVNVAQIPLFPGQGFQIILRCFPRQTAMAFNDNQLPSVCPSRRSNQKPGRRLCLVWACNVEHPAAFPNEESMTVAWHLLRRRSQHHMIDQNHGPQRYASLTLQPWWETV